MTRRRWHWLVEEAAFIALAVLASCVFAWFVAYMWSRT